MKNLIAGLLLLVFAAGTALASAPGPDNPQNYDKSRWEAQEHSTIKHPYAPDHLLIALQRVAVDQFRSTNATPLD
jgi:hypothetical protein